MNELAHEAVFRQISPEKRANLTTSEHTAITLGCGITAVRSSVCRCAAMLD